VYTSQGGWVRVSSGTWTKRTTTVYNFEVEGFHTYFVGKAGLWVHNNSVLGPVGASNGWTRVSRWMSPKEAEVWRGRSSMPQPLGDRTQVTSFGAPRPGAANNLARVDFEVPSHALQPGGTSSWFNIFNQGRAVPVREVKVVPQP
jgi:hypothetical protein